MVVRNPSRIHRAALTRLCFVAKKSSNQGSRYALAIARRGSRSDRCLRFLCCIPIGFHARSVSPLRDIRKFCEVSRWQGLLRASACTVIPFVLLNPFFEELIVRAYLMTEVQDLTGSSALAILVSVIVQFSYHLYYGWAGAISLSFQFLIFALYYARSRNISPVIVAHGLFDIYGIVRLW